MTTQNLERGQSRLYKWYKFVLPWVDVLAITAWGALFLKYWFTDQLKLLIHPNYFWLTAVTGISLLALSSLKVWQLLLRLLNRASRSAQPGSIQHITLLPRGLSSGLLLGVAILGFSIPPGVLTSQMALQRGVTDSLPLTQSQPQAFQASVQPEERSLIDWVRTLNVYPEPDAYMGQKVNVQGFVVHPSALPDNYLLITRFVITCCAVDAYPVALPVKLNRSRNAYPPDTWLEVKGEMMTETLEVERQIMTNAPSDDRQLVIDASSVEKIPTPADPYEY